MVEGPPRKSGILEYILVNSKRFLSFSLNFGEYFKKNSRSFAERLVWGFEKWFKCKISAIQLP